MAYSTKGACGIRSNDSSPLRLSPRTMPLHKRPARLPPLEMERKNVQGSKSPRPPPPPPSPAPWSWYHRDCVHPHLNGTPRGKRAVHNDSQTPPLINTTVNIRKIAGALPAVRDRKDSFLEGNDEQEQDISLQMQYVGDRGGQAPIETTIQNLSVTRSLSECSSPSAAMLQLQRLVNNMPESVRLAQRPSLLVKRRMLIKWEKDEMEIQTLTKYEADEM